MTEMAIPSLVDLCSTYAVAGDLGGDVIYRLASGYAHGKQWTLLTSDATQPEGAAPGSPGAGRVTASDNVSALVTLYSVHTFAAAVADLERYARS